MGLEQQWSEMMSGWAAQQRAFLEAVTSGMEESAGPNDEEASAVPPLLALYQQFVKSAQSTPVSEWLQTLNAQGEKLTEQAQSLWSSAESLQSLLKETGKEQSEMITQLMSPDSWMSQVGGDFDVGMERLSEGASFAGFWDVDKKMARAQSSWVELRVKSAVYHGVVLKAWSEAFQSFVADLDNWNPADDETGLRSMLDNWLEHANEALVEMHKSEEFLKAQRELIRAGMNYRLDEKAVAEDLCGLLHIPGRQEVDELHKRVTELRREVRRLTKQLNAEQAKSRASAVAKPKAAAKKTTAKTKSAAAKGDKA